MTKRVSFLQMFSQYSPPAPLEELLAQAAIQNAELDMEERAIFLELQCAAYIPRRLLDGACRDLRELYDVHRVEILPHFPGEALGRVEQEELMQLFVEMEERKTPEAKLYKALDKLEALIQHNEAKLSTWLPLEYDLQMTYGSKECSFCTYMEHLRETVREDSRRKIRKESEQQ